MIADLKIIDKCLKGELNGTLTILMYERAKIRNRYNQAPHLEYKCKCAIKSSKKYLVSKNTWFPSCGFIRRELEMCGCKILNILQTDLLILMMTDTT